MITLLRIIFLAFISLSIELELTIDIYEISEYFDIIEKVEITEEDSKKLINSLVQILERYVFLDIAKNPPQPKENYFNKVDLIKELNSINTQKRSLYEFYRDVKSVICKCQDLHLDINLERNFTSTINLLKSEFVSPITLYIQDTDVYALPTPNAENIFDQNIMDIIYANIQNPVKTIKGLDPIEYIQKFNGNFNKLKNNHAQFTSNKNIMVEHTITQFPFRKDELTNIELVYSTGRTVNLNYKVLTANDEKQLLSKIYDIPTNFNNSFINYNLLKPKQHALEYYKKNSNILKDIKWDKIFENGILKCKVDSTNNVNVIFQSTFTVQDLVGSINFLGDCFDLFDDNNYPIVVIESNNNGGLVLLANYFKSFLNLNIPNVNYMSLRYNDYVKNNLAKTLLVKDINTCKYKSGEDLFKTNYISDNYGKDEDNNEVIHKRTEIFDFSFVNEILFYDLRKNAKNIRKPHEIIIFTDSFSFSATSIFIKGIQSNGGAIIVGYSGNPKQNLDFFDSSQSPSAVQSISDSQDDLSKEIKKLGFSFTYPYMETFSKLDSKDEMNYPLEYVVNLVDERVGFYNGYDDLLYQDFIDESLRIFDYYKERCNPNNKKLLKISEKCTFSDSKMRGGYECNDEGYWSENCIPSFCENGYRLDKKENKCVEDICLKQRQAEEEEEKKRKNSQDDGKESSIKAFKIVTRVFFSLLILCIIIFLVCHCIGGFSTGYLCIPIILFLIITVIFFILFMVNK